MRCHCALPRPWSPDERQLETVFNQGIHSNSLLFTQAWLIDVLCLLDRWTNKGVIVGDRHTRNFVLDCSGHVTMIDAWRVWSVSALKAKRGSGESATAYRARKDQYRTMRRSRVRGTIDIVRLLIDRAESVP